MIRRILTIALAWLAAALVASPIAAAARPAAQVNPFVGTAAGAADFGTGGGAGNTFPGAVRPFGMVQLSPDTLPGEEAFGGGYSYGDSRIGAFSFKHMSGPGCAAYQDFPLTPTTQPITSSPAKPNSTGLADRFALGFSHAAERASPGRYEVTLDPGTPAPIRAQLSATVRTGIARFSFPRGADASLLLNASGATMGTSAAQVQIHPRRREVTGTGTSGQFCYQGNRYTLHFAARFDRPFRSFGTWKRDELAPGSTAASDSIPGNPVVLQPIPGGPSGSRGVGSTAATGAYVGFDMRSRRTVEARVGLSFVSAGAARKNLRAESARRRFGEIRRAAGSAWNRMLGRVHVRGGSRANRRVFYTQLYHALLHPSTFSDADGRYMGFDGRVRRLRRGERYADFSGWDTYRSQMPLVAMLAPGRASDMVRSLIAAWRESGALPKWSQANGHTHVMVGDPADPLIAGAWAFGARDFSARAALEAMVQGAERYGPARTSPPYFQRAGLPQYLGLGYVPYELNADPISATLNPELAWGSAATTLEYALADFAVARLAGARCRRGIYTRFQRRSGNWRAGFDPASRLVQPRRANGEFVPVAPSGQDGFVEGSAAQYTFAVPHDPAGLAEAMGGRDAALARLDDHFTEVNAGPDSPYAFLGNEPSLGAPWLYDWLGRPDRTQELVRRAMLELYADSPGGLPGNDDLGAMASWWVLGALGFYPAVPGTDILALGSPLFPRATLRLPEGTLRILARGAAPQRPYLRRLRLDGRAWRKPWLRFRRLARGGVLSAKLGPRPDAGFGRSPAAAPPSFGPEQPLRC